ncbi:MAG: hypothetical protein ABIU29_05970 [Chthoniobacterales bacterium]
MAKLKEGALVVVSRRLAFVARAQSKPGRATSLVALGFLLEAPGLEHEGKEIAHRQRGR